MNTYVVKYPIVSSLSGKVARVSSLTVKSYSDAVWVAQKIMSRLQTPEQLNLVSVTVKS